MDSLDGILYGLSVAFTFNNLLAALVGALAGTLIGVLPGLGPTAGIAMILPLSYSLDPTSGIDTWHSVTSRVDYSSCGVANNPILFIKRDLN